MYIYISKIHYVYIHSDKLVRGQILKARKFSRSEVLNKQKRMGNKSRIVF